MERREAGQETIYHYHSGRYKHFDHRTGQEQLCNVKGDPVPKFLCGVSGFADTSERRRRGHGPTVAVLEAAPDLPYLQLPAKFCGYAQCARAGIHMSADATEAYKLPKYLQPKEIKVGRVSTRATKKEVKGDKWNEDVPSFLATLGSQFDDALTMATFLPEGASIKCQADLEATTARNRQVMLGMKGTMDEAMEKLRKQRTKTAGRFGTATQQDARKAPFNAKSIREKEEDRSRLVNPDKWARDDARMGTDRRRVEMRRRDRYLQYFVEKEDQEARVRQLSEGGGPGGSAKVE